MFLRGALSESSLCVFTRNVERAWEIARFRGRSRHGNVERRRKDQTLVTHWSER